MKKLILSAFICVLSVLCFGEGNCYCPDNLNRLERTNSIGYTTKYGNSFGQTTLTYRLTFLEANNFQQNYSPRRVPKDPEDPFADPIGDAPIFLIILLIGTYLYLKLKPWRITL